MTGLLPGVGRLGGAAIAAIGHAGALSRLAAEATVWAATGPFRSRVLTYRLGTEQCYRVGVQSVPLVMLVALLIGVILVLQTAVTLRTYGQLELVPGLVAVSLTRELGPLLTALILAGRVGAAFTAELGTMVVAEEVLALETMGVRPVGYLVAPRLLACLAMTPCLTLCADLVGLAGGFATCKLEFGMSLGTYVEQTRRFLLARDLVVGEGKSLVFGAIIALAGCYRALIVRGGADEVGRATMQSVVAAMVSIIVADSVFTAIVNAWV